MDTWYVGQVGIIEVETGVDVTTITSADIYYRKPDWTEGHWTADFTTGTVIHYDITTEIDQPGLWTKWGILTYPDTHTEITCTTTFRVYRPGYGGCS
jgi:hypothetical protein